MAISISNVKYKSCKMLILLEFAVVSLLSLFLAHWFLKITPGTKSLFCK